MSEEGEDRQREKGRIGSGGKRMVAARGLHFLRYAAERNRKRTESNGVCSRSSFPKWMR